MNGAKCILQVQDVRPFFWGKYDIIKPPNDTHLAAADEKISLILNDV